MTTGSGVQQVPRDGVWASWAPSGRAAVPAIVLLVIVANLVGVTTVVLLLIGVEDGSGGSGRMPVLLAVAGYLLLALSLGTLARLRRQRVPNRWLSPAAGPRARRRARPSGSRSTPR
jgi:hypothetical protein